MKTYTKIIKMEFLGNLEYRFNLLIGPFSIVSSVSMNCLMWWLIMKSNNLSQINGMTFNDFAFYFTLAFIVHQLRSNWDVNFEIIEDIRRGLVTRFLTRPISFFWNYFSIWIGRNIGFFIIYCFLLLGLKLLFPGVIFQSFWQPPCFLLSLGISMILSHCIYMNIVVLNFWFHDLTGFIMGFNFFATIVFGTLIPYSFYPEWSMALINWSPFPYVVSLPINIARGQLDLLPAITGCGQAVLWTLILGGLFKLVYSRAIRAYGAYGG